MSGASLPLMMDLNFQQHRAHPILRKGTTQVRMLFFPQHGRRLTHRTSLPWRFVARDQGFADVSQLGTPSSDDRSLDVHIEVRDNPRPARLDLVREMDPVSRIREFKK